VHPRSITAIEIQNGAIGLVKWEMVSRLDPMTGEGLLTIARELVADGPVPLLEVKYAIWRD
jgi:hypothetical protein